MRTKKTRRARFSVRTLRQRKAPPATHYLSKPVTFWVAVLSLFAFVSGNMLGTQGWTVFWRSVLGNADDVLVAYEGTFVAGPIPLVPDPIKWAKYGGDQRVHTFQQAPQDVLIAYPKYVPFDQRGSDPVANRLYSVDFAGTYATGGGKGSHAGIDMTAPRGTPVVAVMNGIVVHAESDSGYGNYIILRHPNVPDPDAPGKSTTLYSLYAHMDSETVSRGMIVKKGEQIGTVGRTGDATGYHLHFAIQRMPDAWWPFTYADARAANVSFNQAIDSGLNRDVLLKNMANPMLYVQSNFSPLTPVVAQTSSSAAPRVQKTAQQLRDERLQARVARRDQQVAVAHTTSTVVVAQNDVIVPAPVVVVSAPVSATSTQKPITAYQIDLAREVSERSWQKVRISLLDDQGAVLKNPVWDRDITLRTAYGQADFKPEVLKRSDFVNGVAEVQMLPRGRTTIVVQLMPQNVLSTPMKVSAN